MIFFYLLCFYCFFCFVFLVENPNQILDTIVGVSFTDDSGAYAGWSEDDANKVIAFSDAIQAQVATAAPAANSAFSPTAPRGPSPAVVQKIAALIASDALRNRMIALGLIETQGIFTHQKKLFYFILFYFLFC
jgi:hypothetical protein